MFSQIGKRIGRKACLLATAVSLACAVFAASSAQATTYCSGTYGGYGTCAGPFVGLYANLVQTANSGSAVCAGAADIFGQFYGQYYCALRYACHTYGGEGLYPYSHNHESYAQPMSANYYTLRGSVPGSCPHGGPVSKQASVGATALARPTGALPNGSGDLSQTGNEACLTLHDPGHGDGVSCQPMSEAARGSLWGSLESPVDGTSTLIAIAPRGATKSVIQTAAGQSKTVPVHDGMVTAVLAAPVANVTYAAG